MLRKRYMCTMYMCIKNIKKFGFSTYSSVLPRESIPCEQLTSVFVDPCLYYRVLYRWIKKLNKYVELWDLEGQGPCGCGASSEVRTLLILQGPRPSKSHSSTDFRCLITLDCSYTTEYSSERDSQREPNSP